MKLLYILSLLLLGCKKTDPPTANNFPPLVSLEAKLTKTAPFTYQFTANASDQDFDPLTYDWDFGNGQTKKAGQLIESSTFQDGKSYTVKVSVSDGKNTTPTVAQLIVSTEFSTATIDNAKTFQTMEGFGGFGAQDVYWSGGPYTSDRFVDDMVNDLGCTIIRDEVPTSFEIENDNADPNVTDLTKYNFSRQIDGHHAPLARRIPHFKAMYAAGVRTFIASVWSPAPWMKHNNRIDNGTPNNSAPGYTRNPNSNTNQLKVENYEEFAESLVAYCRIFKREVGIDLYALSVQNEPRFSQSYQSSVYDGEALRDVMKVVGARFKREGLTTKLFLPEDVGFLDGVRGMTLPSLNDPVSRQYTDIVATHGYALDGIAPGSTDAQTWQTMFSWGNQYNKPHWMTETSGYKNTFDGSNDLARAMYTAIRFGNVSAWVFWSLSESTLSEYSLLSSSGTKSKRYYVSKQFFRYIRPGAVRVDVTSTDNSILTLGFNNAGVSTVVCINVSTTDKAVKITGGTPNYRVIRTSSEDNAKEVEPISNNGIFIVPARGVTTLYSGN